MTVIDEIAAERGRQIDTEGWDAAHDDQHYKGEIARAAAVYAWAGSMQDWARHPKKDTFAEWWGLNHSPLRQLWPWEWHWFKPKDRRRDLIRAGALIVAEIERLDRNGAYTRRTSNASDPLSDNGRRACGD